MAEKRQFLDSDNKDANKHQRVDINYSLQYSQLHSDHLGGCRIVLGRKKDRPNKEAKESTQLEVTSDQTYAKQPKQSKCAWCCRSVPLMNGKKYCVKCGHEGKECAYCHRPMPHRFFSLSDRICNACCRKYSKQATKRKARIRNDRKVTTMSDKIEIINQSGSGIVPDSGKPTLSKSIENTPDSNSVVTDANLVQPINNTIPTTSSASNDTVTNIPLTNQTRVAHVHEESSLNGYAHVTTIYPTRDEDMMAALAETEHEIISTLSLYRKKLDAIKYYISCTAEYEKMDSEGEVQVIDMMFHTDALPLMNDELVDEHIAANFHQLNKNAEEFEAEGSGWNLKRVLSIKVHMGAYTPLAGSGYIPLPKLILSKKAVLNIENEDHKCIKWCILAHMFPRSRGQHPERVTSYYQYDKHINMTGVSFPTPLKDIAKIENNNGLSINVFAYDQENGITPQRISRQMKEGNEHVNLLLLTAEGKRHYCLIRNFSRLLADRTKHNGKQYYCFNCLHGYSQESLRDQHYERCLHRKAQKAVYPKEGERILKFKNIAHQLPAPFVIYADFECFTTKISTCGTDPGKSSTNKYQRHDPSGFCCITVCSEDASLSRNPIVFRGNDVVEEFYKQLFKEEEYIRQILDKPKPLIMSRDNEKMFKDAVKCHICEKKLDDDRVRDHNHITGKFRGAAHNECNLAYKYKKMNSDFDQFIIPVVFHNLRGYDAHIMMKKLGKYKSRKLQCIPNNKERYISFTVGNLRFIDSYQFMGAPLNELVSDLAQKGKENFKYMLNEVRDIEQQDLLLRKGVYPYDYMDGPAKLTETKLPPHDSFYSLLSEEGISQADYAHALAVWEKFKCKTLGDYHDLYMKSDVLLLADVFESFRKLALAIYLLDPAHYYTSPGLSWDSMLRYTRVELQVLHDPDMYLLVESGIRGGVSMITKKWASANNPYMEQYDASKPSNYIMYLDANNLYGWAMSQKMPLNNFEWVPKDRLQSIDVAAISTSADEGYILEVDLEYPQHLHDTHSDYPLAPQTKPIQRNELSAYSQHLAEKLNVKGRPQAKLMTTLDNRTNYVVHYINLKMYLKLGMRLTKVHRAVKFHQSNWLNSYIALNTEKRKQAQNTFEKNFYKLMNNSVFGKTMENVRGHVEMELVHTKERLLKLTAKPTFQKFHIFNKDLCAVRMLKTTIKLNKPLYVGFSILDQSKTLMYDFHYNHIKAKYGSNAQLCFTDTDSLMYDITTDDIFNDISSDIDLFDTSAYPVEHMLHNQTNKKVLGKMKDEMSGQIINEFIGLRSKMYSIKSGTDEKKTAKGIKKSAIRRLRHAKYKDALLNGTVTLETMRTIRSMNHELFTLEVNKVGLCAFDDKRYVLEDKFTTRAHGHYRNVTVM